MRNASIPERIEDQLPLDYIEYFGPYLARLLFDALKEIFGSYPRKPSLCPFVRGPVCLGYKRDLEFYAYIVWLFIFSTYRRGKFAELSVKEIREGVNLSDQYVRDAVAYLKWIGFLLQEPAETEHCYTWKVRWNDAWIWCPVPTSILARTMPPKAKVAVIRLIPLVIRNRSQAVDLYDHEFGRLVGCVGKESSRRLRKKLAEYGFLETIWDGSRSRERTTYRVDMFGEGIFEP